MKKLLFVSVGMLLLAVTSCNQNKSKDNVAGTEQNDSLQQILAQKDTEINDMMGLMNEVQEGFRQINEAEKMARELTRNRCSEITLSSSPSVCRRTVNSLLSCVNS